MPTQVLGNALIRVAAKLFGGVQSHHILHPDEVEVLRARFLPTRRRFYLVLVPSTILVGGALAYLLIEWRLAHEGLPQAPVLDERTRMMQLGLGVGSLGLALLAGIIAEALLLRRVLGIDRETWIRYFATVHHWLPHRQVLFNAGLWLSICAIFFLFGMNFGERVDERGISFPSMLWSRQNHKYSDVTSIEHYDSLKALAGQMPTRNLVVRFATGPAWEYVPSGNTAATAQAVGEYIAERSNVPVTYAAVRP